jgi:uncharacterized coiled-coil DUF342 family protein
MATKRKIRKVRKTTGSKPSALTSVQRKAINKKLDAVSKKITDKKAKAPEVKKAIQSAKKTTAVAKKKVLTAKDIENFAKKVVGSFVKRYNETVKELKESDAKSKKLTREIATLHAKLRKKGLSAKEKLDIRKKIQKLTDEKKKIDAMRKDRASIIRDLKANYRKVRQDIKTFIKNYGATHKRGRSVNSCSTAASVLGKTSALEGRIQVQANELMNRKYSLGGLKEGDFEKKVIEILTKSSAAGRKLRSCRK